MNWVICPIHNGLSMTKALIPDLLAQNIGDVEVLFLLNGAVDGSAEYIRSLGNRRLHVVNVPPPHGVSRAWNHGLSWCFESGAKYVLVVNNDIRMRPDTYRLLVEDGGAFVTAIGSDDPESVAQLVLPTAPKRPHPDFSCYLIRKECWDRVGQFDEGFIGGYCEDWDYHCRMHQAGITAECLDLPFYHIASGTLKDCDEDEQDRIREQAAHNREYFHRKWGFEGATPEYEAFFATPPPPEAASIPVADVDHGV